MKKIDVGRTITILANLGVIAGILLLVYELNQSRRLAAAQIRNDISQTAVMTRLTMAENGATSILRRVTRGEQIEPHEWELASASLSAVFRHWENQDYQYRIGLYDQSEWDAIRVGIRTTLSVPSIWQYWCETPDTFSAPFVADIDELMGNQTCE
jgi:hypothetical protein